MPRNLVLCCDGTWNTPQQTDRGRVVPSNVVKMARAVDLDSGDPEQLLYYDAGIGTGRGLDHWTGGAFGVGLTENILQAYAWLAKNYQDDDRIVLFGFSRGAYTVRSLAGLVSRCGLQPAGNAAMAQEAYDIYRTTSGADDKAARAFRQQAGQRCPPIHFLGVWDTVGALGVPTLSRYGLLRKLVRTFTKDSKYAHGFHDQELSKDVDYAYHALAIDERRGPFAPALWHVEPKGQVRDREKVQQVWFTGVHSNVGGGYVDAGLSDHALMWMAKKAIGAGLQLERLYLALRLDPNAHGELRNSMSLQYRAIPIHQRRIGDTRTLNEFVHQSAINRANNATNGYRATNVLEEEPPGSGRWRPLANVPITADGIDLVTEIRHASQGLVKWSVRGTPPRRAA